MRGNKLCLSFGTEIIYDNASFLLNEKDKVGIVGVNGAGKTTLFQVILRKQHLDTGSITISSHKRIGYLPQEVIINNDETVIDYLLHARPIAALEQQLVDLYEKVAVAPLNEQTKILKKISKVQEELEYYDCYQAENILFEIISKMGIDSEILDRKVSDLSGGQKSKIAFAHLLYEGAEILLLDEPTNHLDIETRNYITNYLKDYKGMVLIISHDIPFLNAITSCTMHIDKTTKQIDVYKGNYELFLKKQDAAKEQKEKLIEKQEKEQEKLKSIVLQYSNSSGKRKRMAQSREKQLSKLEQNMIAKEKNYKKVKLNIKPNREGSKVPLKVNSITFGYNEKKLINDLSFSIQDKERFLIVGENGVGKSTLLKLIVGKVKPEEGNIWYGSKTDIAYYAQEQEELDLDKTILENIDSSSYSEKELRTILGSFLFYGDDVYKKICILSPGERARIALCKIVLKKANLLILDEPTNHLDPITQEIIGRNFKDYEGTLILVSHNKSFANSIGINRMLQLPSGKILNYQEELLDHYAEINK